MAQGDAIIVGCNVSSGGSQNVVPGSGVEWCFSAGQGGTYIALEAMYSDSSGDFITSGGWGGASSNNDTYLYSINWAMRLFVNSTRYVRFRPLAGSNQRGHLSGIQSK